MAFGGVFSMSLGYLVLFCLICVVIIVACIKVLLEYLKTEVDIIGEGTDNPIVYFCIKGILGNKLYKFTIFNANKYFLDMKRPTRNELILYQLQTDMSEDKTKNFEKVFAKILKG